MHTVIRNPNMRRVRYTCDPLGLTGQNLPNQVKSFRVRLSLEIIWSKGSVCFIATHVEIGLKKVSWTQVKHAF